MLHTLNSIFPVRYTVMGLSVFGLLLSVFSLVALGAGLGAFVLFAILVGIGTYDLRQSRRSMMTNWPASTAASAGGRRWASV